MKFPRTKKADAIIPTGSMADIAFLLIIFFMVTTTNEVDRTSVNLPSAAITQEAEKGAAIVVLFSADGEIFYKFSDGDNMSKAVNGPEDIYFEASQLTYADPEKQFILKADGTTKFSLVDELLDRLREGNVKNVLLLASPKEVGT